MWFSTSTFGDDIAFEEIYNNETSYKSNCYIQYVLLCYCSLLVNISYSILCQFIVFVVVLSNGLII